MKRCKNCKSCWYVTKNVQIDMGAHVDICEVGEKVFGTYGGALDLEKDADETIECPCYKPKPKRSFEGLDLEKFKDVFDNKRTLRAVSRAALDQMLLYFYMLYQDNNPIAGTKELPCPFYCTKVIYDKVKEYFDENGLICLSTPTGERWFRLCNPYEEDNK